MITVFYVRLALNSLALVGANLIRPLLLSPRLSLPSQVPIFHRRMVAMMFRGGGGRYSWGRVSYSPATK